MDVPSLGRNENNDAEHLIKRKVLMTRSWNKVGFKNSYLASLIAILLSPSVYALEALSDDYLSTTTGEGVALLPENFKMVFQGPNDLSNASSYNQVGLVNPEKYDTGFIRIIPTGENYTNLKLTAAEAAAKRTKADTFIYGLALSASNNNLNQRFSNTGFNWGISANPWLFRAGTANNIQQFSSTNVAGDISYLVLETPLASIIADESDNNIKLGFWADAFLRSWNSSNAINPITGAPVAKPVANDPSNDVDLDKNKRIRLQYVANGLSLSGSQVRLFQTMPSTTAQYNQTLGMASVLRLNTNDNPANLKFTDAGLDAKAIRLSTATTNDGTYSTPALQQNSEAPLFNDKEGIYLYSPNINLVLGNMYQPFVLGSEGSNIFLEVTRIPNVPNIYKKIYTNYDVPYSSLSATSEYQGSTCNVYVCGFNTSSINSGSNTINYQGNNATHSSIAIGSVTRDPSTNLLKANTGADATGVVFRSPTGTAVNLGSVAIDGVLIQHLKFKTTGL